MNYTPYIPNIWLTGWKVLGRLGKILVSILASLNAEDVCTVSFIKAYLTDQLRPSSMSQGLVYP